ncbi:RNA-directed DNA polymerase [Helicobacter anatolicus]|uniref:RNA-directed DNA polymerase n=1 Tax=Helicobacter anatolicus TaxID=2905874 RepID=UPI001E5A1A7F|nr:RNA-directed DNA polymerase [Helicobacter anatolicus]MCE3038215.1 RNA-directed DNA polymerase [Helicobacter anatolicus]
MGYKNQESTKTYYECLNQITTDELYEGLLGYGMFAEKIPNFLTSETFFEFCKSNEPCFEQKEYRYIKYENMRNINIPRILSIPHPFVYYKQCKVLKESWKKLKKYFYKKTKSNKYKISRIHIRKLDNKKFIDYRDYNLNNAILESKIIQKIFNMNFKNYKFDGAPEQEIFIGKRYKVKADISNCFPSIYTHAISWALVGKKMAKEDKNKGKDKPYYNEIDKSTQWLNYGETHGILIGPHSSNLISEIILVAADYKLSKKYEYIRNIDDYTCYVKSYEEAEKFLLDLSMELKKYGLSLNHKKTEIIELPSSFEEEWVRKLKLFKLDSYNGKIKYTGIAPFLDMALELMKDNKNNAAILNYAFQILIKNKMTSSAKKYFINTIHHLVLLYPYLIFLLDEIFQKNIISQEYIKKISLDIFSLGKEKRNYEAMSYALYFALKYNFKLKEELSLLEEAKREEDCILMLLCYLYDKKNDNDIEEYKKVAKQFITNQTLKKNGNITILDDEYWLFAYEVLLREDDKVLDQCIDWKQLKNKNISFIKQEFQ